MGLISLMRMVRRKDGPQFLACVLVGYLIAYTMVPGVGQVYASMLISFHLFLGWLVYSGMKQKNISSLPVLPSLLKHVCFLAPILLLPLVRHSIPLFGLLRFAITIFAKLESNWLLYSPSVVESPEAISVAVVQPEAAPLTVIATEPVYEPRSFTAPVDATPAHSVRATSSPVYQSNIVSLEGADTNNGQLMAMDHQAWLHHLSNRRPSDMKRGLPLKDEYKQWMKARADHREKVRIAKAAAEPSAAVTPAKPVEESQIV